MNFLRPLVTTILGSLLLFVGRMRVAMEGDKGVT